MIQQSSTIRQAGGRLLLCGLVLCGAMTACSDNSSPTGPTPGPGTPSSPQVQIVDRTFTLALNQVASVPGEELELTFRRVVSDNRCPGDAICLAAMAGDAVLEFDVVQRQNGLFFGHSEQLSTHPNRSRFRTTHYNVQLEQVMPYPFGSLPPIKPEDWRATVRITSIQN